MKNRYTIQNGKIIDTKTQTIILFAETTKKILNEKEHKIEQLQKEKIETENHLLKTIQQILQETKKTNTKTHEQIKKIIQEQIQQ